MQVGTAQPTRGTGNTMVQMVGITQRSKNNKAIFLLDLQIRPDKQVIVIAKQLDSAVIHLLQKTTVGKQLEHQKRKEYESLNKYQRLKTELERMWKVKPMVVPLVIETLIQFRGLGTMCS